MTEASGEKPSYWIESDEKLLLNRFGTWLANGQEITHEPTCRAFSKKIQRDATGYFIQLGPEKKRIAVEDTPYFIRRVDGSPSEGYELWLSDETRERLHPKSLKYRPGRLVCTLARGEDARFIHPAYIDLMRHLQEDEKGYFIPFGELRVELALKEAP